MKEIVNFFAGRRYSAVSQREMQVIGTSQKPHKSLQNKPALSRGVSVVDAFFHDRKSGERTRLPKCKLNDQRTTKCHSVMWKNDWNGNRWSAKNRSRASCRCASTIHLKLSEFLKVLKLEFKFQIDVRSKQSLLLPSKPVNDSKEILSIFCPLYNCKCSVGAYAEPWSEPTKSKQQQKCGKNFVNHRKLVSGWWPLLVYMKNDQLLVLIDDST